MIEISEEEYAKLKAAEQALMAIRARENKKTKERFKQLKCISVRVNPEFHDILKSYCNTSGVSVRQTIIKAIEEFTSNEVSARKA